MVTLIKEIQHILSCSEVYAQKLIQYAAGDIDKLIYQIERQLYKQGNNQAVFEVKVYKANRGVILKKRYNSLDYIQKHKYV